MRKKLLTGIVVLAAMLIVGMSAISVSAASIPRDAGKYNGHYYYVYPNGTCSSYEDAIQYCKKRGGYLATITTDKENEYVYKYMMEKGYGMAYFGYYNTTNGWKWVDGTKSNYTNWNPGEPEGQKYVRYKNNYGGTWVDDYWGTFSNTSFICEWDAEQISISGANVTLSKTSYTYNGKDKKPSVTVKYDGKKLKNNMDYSVTYSNNKNVGTATVTIKGIGKYKGTIEKTFKIIAKKVKPKKVTGVSITNVKKNQFVISWKSIKADGYEIQYSTKKSFPIDETTIVYLSSKTVNYSDVGTNKKSKTITGLEKGTKYYIRVRAYNTYNDENKSGSWSSKISKKTAK